MSSESQTITKLPGLDGNRDSRSPEALRARRISFVVLALTVALVGHFRLGTPFLAVLFSYYIISHLRSFKRDWVRVAVFVALVALICTGLGYSLGQTVAHLPNVANKAIPAIIHTAKQHGFELPFTDWESLKDFALDSVKSQLHFFGIFAQNATRQVAFLVIGVVIAVSLFLSPVSPAVREGAAGRADNFYTLYAGEITARFASFFRSFSRVMGAQLIISAINTSLTAIFIFTVGLPYPAVGIGVTFICGLLPIIGNLISNSVLVAIGFTVSPEMALWALVFLIILHKLEYFLNSKIIGKQIKNPVWLTLVGLVVGERLMGITGMILAPVILHFIKEEASQIKIWHKSDNDPGEAAEEPKTVASQKI